MSKHLPRARRSSILKDPRFLLGIALILVSVLATTWLLQRARGGEDVYQLTAPIAEGQVIEASSVAIVSARTGSDAYLPAGSLPEGAIATRTLGVGELLPREAVATADSLSRRQVVINVATRIPSATTVGSKVQVWAMEAPDVLSKNAAEPQMIASSAIILAISEPDNGLANRAQSVEISVSEADLDNVLAATGANSTLVVVPAG